MGGGSERIGVAGGEFPAYPDGKRVYHGMMQSHENLDYFFGNLLHLIGDAGISKRQLSLAIGSNDSYVSEILLRREAPTLETVYAIASVLKVDVADLLRPGPKFGVASRDRHNYWIERTAEEFLASALSKSREAASHEAPSFDAVLNWWHSNGGMLTALDSFEQYIEIFVQPDAEEMKPKPYRIGRESLASRELGINGADHLRQVFEASSPEVSRAVAFAHHEVAGGQPHLSVHTTLVHLSTGNVVELVYNRLLLPLKDGNGQQYIMNYSKPVRRSEIGREKVEEFDARHSRQPVISRLV